MFESEFELVWMFEYLYLLDFVFEFELEFGLEFLSPQVLEGW